MRFTDLHPPLSPLLAAVEERVAEVQRTNYAFLGLAARRALSGRGKRLRPALLLLAAEAAGGAGDTSVVLAAVVEIAHAASLVHDDVVDGAESRRGRRSPNALWGNKLSVLLGDYLVARAFDLIPRSEGEWVAPLLARTARDMCTAQMEELRSAGSPLSEQQYMAIVRGKTASLTSLCCRLGASTAGSPESLIEALAGFGEAFGIAFQLADDILDLVGTNGRSGKPEGRDILERKYTLPLILASGLGGRAIRAGIRRRVASSMEVATVSEVRELVESSGAIRPAWERVREWLAKAENALSPLPVSSARNALAAACREGFPLPVMAGKQS